jgi:glycosyltransferase involved in cell wall biosynthesis
MLVLNSGNMRIGIEVQNMFRKRKHVADITIIELLNQLQQANSGHEFILYAQPDEEKHCMKMNSNMHVNISGPASAYVWQQQLLPQAIKYHDIDLLHCTNNTAPSKIKTPLIVTIHDVITLEKHMVKHGSWYERYENLYAQWNMPRIAKTADVIITVSNYERQRLIDRLHISPEKVKTVYHAYSPHFTAERDIEKMTAFRMKYQLPENFILAFGNTSPEKNLVTTLRALHELYKNNQLHCKLVLPDISRALLNKMLSLEGMSHMQQYFHPIPYIPNKELPSLYKLSAVFLYPTLHESFGVPILEAMACGTPVITSNRPGNVEIAGQQALLVNPADPMELAYCIHNVLTKPQLLQKAIDHGLKNATRFTWQETARQILGIYEQFEA